ncbi:MAG: DUF1997 domain-containing protein [Thermomicrobiales bacterium]
MPGQTADMSLQTSQRATFALPCTVARGIAYLRDPTVVLGALPSIERVIQRPRGAYRLKLAPIQFPGLSLRPAAEVAFVSADGHVTIRSIVEEPHALEPGEVAIRVTGSFLLTPTATGCGVQASLRITAILSAHILPPLIPRIIARRTAEAVLTRRIAQEVQIMTRTLAQGYAAWGDAE